MANKSTNWHITIMAGGRGTRFWPRSRKRRPKQVLNIAGTRTMIQETVKRIEPLVPPEQITIITGMPYRDEILNQLPQLPAANILAEPVGRNTAPCIGLAAALLRREGKTGSMIVLPSDHLIADNEVFRTCLRAAAVASGQEDGLYTIGIPPTRPETGFGYIQTGEQVRQVNGLPVFQVVEFKEKPDRERAEHYLHSGQHLWNGGMFVWQINTIWEAIHRFLPDLYRQLQRVEQATCHALNAQIEVLYQQVEAISIDYAVLEKAQRVFALPGHFGWSDVGSWAALAEVWPPDRQGNVARGTTLFINTAGAVVDSPKRLVALVGLQDVIVVDTEDALLVCAKDQAQEVKKVVAELERRRLEEYL